MALSDIRTKIKALSEEMAGLVAKADLNDADLTRIETIDAESRQLQRQMDALKKAGDFVAWAGKSAGTLPLAAPGGARIEGARPAGEAQVTEQFDSKGRKSILVNDEGECLVDPKLYATLASTEYNQAYKAYLRFGQHGLKSEHLKVLQEGVDTAGGFLAPEQILNRLIAKEPAPTNLAGRVQILNTTRDALTVPRVVYTTDNQYTSGMRVTWTGEVPASATTHRVTEPSFGQVRIPVYTGMLSLPLTNDLVEDSAVDLVAWCTAKFQETIDLLFDNMIINGTGSAQPSGLLINSQFITNDVHTGAASTLTWDGLLDLLYALPEQYDRNAVVVMNKTNTALALAKLQDGNGRPYWTAGAGDYGLAGQRINRDLVGYPVMFNAFMPNVSAGLYPVIFGDLTAYYLVRRVGFSIQVLRELYAETNQALLLGRVRFGGQLVEDWRVRGQVVSA